MFACFLAERVLGGDGLARTGVSGRDARVPGRAAVHWVLLTFSWLTRELTGNREMRRSALL